MNKFSEQDEQLLQKYKTYKRKRRRKYLSAFFLFVIILIFSVVGYSFVQSQDDKVKVIGVDKQPPTLKISDTTIELVQGEVLDYKSFIVSAKDDTDGDVLSSVKYTKVDTSIVGEQEIVFTVSDKAGNKTTHKVKVVIKGKEKEEEEISAEAPLPHKEVVPQVVPTPPKEIVPAPSQRNPIFFYLGENGLDTLNIEGVCNSKASELGGGRCTVLLDVNGNALGMKLVFE